MRICLFSNMFLPSIGGIEIHARMLAEEWVRTRQDVVVVTTTPAVSDFDKQFGFPVIRIKNTSEWKNIVRDCDVILSDGYSIRFLKQWIFARRPVIYIHQSYIGAGGEWGWKWPIRNFIRRQICKLATHNIYISKAIANSIALPKGTIVYNPIDPQFKPLPDVAIENDFAYFGRMWFGKGTDDIVRALHDCRLQGHRYTCDFYGEGSDLEPTRQIAKELDVLDLVRFKGFLRGQDLVRAMNASGIVLMPSRWPEPMGMVATEAMACGKCVIGTNLGGLGEVLEGYAPTINNGDYKQLANEMIRVAESPEIRRAYEQNALVRAKDFEISKIVSQYNDVIRKVLEH